MSRPRAPRAHTATSPARSALLIAALGLAIAACADADPPGDPGALPYETLSEYGFFVGALRDMEPAADVVPYAPISPLWADHAGKGRFVRLPEGTQIDPVGDEDWEYPLGTIFIKSFYLSIDRRDPEGDAKIIETRLLIREDVPEQWTAHTYVWNDAQTEATRLIAGRRVTVPVTNADGEDEDQVYLVPNTNQCNDCHARDDVSVILGFNSYQLGAAEGGGTTQLQTLVDAGLFVSQPTLGVDPLVAPDGSAPLADRARAYLHANCSHCHRPGGDGGRSGLDLRNWQSDPARFGICKAPVAAGAGTGGRQYDIVPGHPEDSIIPYRMRSTDPEVRMPELPSRIPDTFGADLVAEWIAAMDPVDCDANN